MMAPLLAPFRQPLRQILMRHTYISSDQMLEYIIVVYALDRVRGSRGVLGGCIEA